MCISLCVSLCVWRKAALLIGFQCVMMYPSLNVWIVLPRLRIVEVCVCVSVSILSLCVYIWVVWLFVDICVDVCVAAWERWFVFKLFTWSNFCSRVSSNPTSFCLQVFYSTLPFLHSVHNCLYLFLLYYLGWMLKVLYKFKMYLHPAQNYLLSFLLLFSSF